MAAMSGSRSLVTCALAACISSFHVAQSARSSAESNCTPRASAFLTIFSRASNWRMTRVALAARITAAGSLGKLRRDLSASRSSRAHPILGVFPLAKQGASNDSADSVEDTAEFAADRILAEAAAAPRDAADGAAAGLADLFFRLFFPITCATCGWWWRGWPVFSRQSPIETGELTLVYVEDRCDSNTHITRSFSSSLSATSLLPTLTLCQRWIAGDIRGRRRL
mmetsp:Transcript_36655/g.82431  ORF Transcript_36655/g.82431 Transcript_36655/m.82431 type:complete len:224 (-) Transcript_36655:102-773(-)